VANSSIHSPFSNFLHGLNALFCVWVIVATFVVLPSVTAGSSAVVKHSGDYHGHWQKGISTTGVEGKLTGFTPTLGATRAQVEALFHYLDGNHTTFRVASKIKGVPRVLGGDTRLFTVVEINGYPEVIDVQVVTILDTSSKSILEQQITYDALTCREFSTATAQKWCTGRILDTNADGLITATKSKVFGGLDITVRTYRSTSSSAVPIVSVDISAL
jgi:hypothetical protein